MIDRNNILQNKKWRPSIQSVLFAVSLFFLMLPFAGIYILRIYESALIRQTESELISQAAFVSALYKHDIKKQLSNQHIPIQQYGIALPKSLALSEKEQFAPVPVSLDLAKDKIYPPRTLPRRVKDSLDKTAKKSGAAIEPVIKDAQRTTLSGIKVLDYQGLVSAGQYEKGLSFSHTEEFARAKNGQPVSLLRQRVGHAEQSDFPSRNANINVFVALPIILENRLIGVVWVNRTPTDLVQALSNKRYEVTWMVVFLLLAVAFVTVFTAYAITRPIRALVQQTELIAKEDAKGLTPIAHPTTTEIAALSDSIMLMAATLQERNHYVRDLSAHISHALKTPITAIQGATELLLDTNDDMPFETRQKFLNNIASDTNRLKRYVERLLTLAKADLQDIDTDACLLKPILQAICQDWKNEQFTLKLSLDNIPENSYVLISDVRLKALFNNLLENSAQAGASTASLTADIEKNTVRLTLCDNGPGISSGNQAQIFTPFFTTRQHEGGTGLGLSIVQSILSRQGGSIQLIPSEVGACFEIRLPKVSMA